MINDWGGEICYFVQICLPQIAKFMGPTWSPPGSRRSQMGPILAPRALLLGTIMANVLISYANATYSYNERMIYGIDVSIVLYPPLTHLPPGQNGRPFGRRQFQMHFRE